MTGESALMDLTVSDTAPQSCSPDDTGSGSGDPLVWVKGRG